MSKKEIKKILSTAYEALDTPQIKAILEIANNKTYLKLRAIECIRDSMNVGANQNNLKWAVILLAIADCKEKD